MNYNPQGLTVTYKAGHWHVNGEVCKLLTASEMLDGSSTRAIFVSPSFVLKFDNPALFNGRQAYGELVTWSKVQARGIDRDNFAELLAYLQIDGHRLAVTKRYDFVSQDLTDAQAARIEELADAYGLLDVSPNTETNCGNYGITSDGKLIIYDYGLTV